ncbi:hypothetical protein EVA_11609 [gut metagenome]|uniref:Uncharacterized protein n=1 Tax=gut metagenome TaxID=749906 RepID=J9G0C2_9ZZZZ
MAREHGVHRVLDARGAVLARGVAHDVGREGARRDRRGCSCRRPPARSRPA